MIEVAPLVGYKALSAMHSFQVLMIGLKMLPFYGEQAPEEFFARFGKLSDEEKEKFIRLAVTSVPLEKKEVEALLSLAKDKHGVCYSALNIGNLGLADIIENIVAVCKELARIEIPWISDEEKKKSLSTLELMSEPNT